MGSMWRRRLWQRRVLPVSQHKKRETKREEEEEEIPLLLLLLLRRRRRRRRRPSETLRCAMARRSEREDSGATK